MEPANQLEAVLEAFARVGIEVRQECLGGDGGSLCRLRGRRVLFVDLDADIATRLDHAIAALADVAEAASFYLPPEIRERIGRASM